MNRRKLIAEIGAAVIVIAVIITITALQKRQKDPKYIEPGNRKSIAKLEETHNDTQNNTQVQEVFRYEAEKTARTTTFPDSVVSKKGILIDVGNKEIVAARGAHDKIYPASMTKILTVLVAAEHIDPGHLDDKVAIDIDATDYSYRNDCSNTGYEVGEQVTVRDLFYGTILPSGADSAYSLAVYVAGSHEAFVDMMNEKLEEMGISDTTHMTNCVGIYDDDHYSTPYDMAIILKAASDNKLCNDVLSKHVYTTSKSKQHKKGLTVSNWFLRRIEDKDTHGTVLCAKTGFVNQSGNCAASLAADSDGNEYICVTEGSTSSWRCIYDHVDIYSHFLKTKDAEKE